MLSKSMLTLVLSLLFLAIGSTLAASASPIPPSPVSQRTVNLGNIQYYFSPSFVMTARNVKTHRLLWTRSYNPNRFFYRQWVTAEPYQLSLQVYHGTLYASDNIGMTALRVTDGAQLWRGTYPNEAEGLPTIREGVVLTTYESSGAISAGAIQAVDSRTGRFLWRVVGVSGFDRSNRRKGYLLCHLAQYMGSSNKTGATCWLNIHTGE